MCAAISFTKSIGPLFRRAVTRSAASTGAFGRIAPISLKANVRCTGVGHGVSPFANGMAALSEFEQRVGGDALHQPRFGFELARVLARDGVEMALAQRQHQPNPISAPASGTCARKDFRSA